MNASKSKGGFDQLRLALWQASDALQFYADPRNYPTFVEKDKGAKARLALQALKGEDA